MIESEEVFGNREVGTAGSYGCGVAFAQKNKRFGGRTLNFNDSEFWQVLPITGGD